MKKNLKVIDFFCGAGGFSEGFRQQGFDIVMGIDNWAVAIKTHNFNHSLNDQTKDVLDFGSSIDEINKLPNTEVIVGSPPCVLFSLSNKGGKSDKTMGIKLIESFLRVIAVKKHQPSSTLVAWFMENVPNSKNYIKSMYTFRELNLVKWAKQHRLNPDAIALNGSNNGNILNTANFWTSQKRERFVCGEIVETGRFPDLQCFTNKEHRSIGEIRRKMPPPNLGISTKVYTDPNYSSLTFQANKITDHFYDSGIYEIQWKSAQAAKLNHPFMGKMSFPENENKPSRTIMATRSLTVRESLIYKSEYKRNGDGEYRLPTIRELATLMGFPYSYQFAGSENNKCRQIGNAVCPPMSAALAKSVRLSLGLPVITDSDMRFNDVDAMIPQIDNLNTFSKMTFDNPPKRKRLARFRKHPFKDGNMTVALTNFNPTKAAASVPGPIEWHSSIFIGCGKDFKIKTIPKCEFTNIAKIIKLQHNTHGERFIAEFDKTFKSTFGKTDKFQSAYVDEDRSVLYEPGRLIDAIGDFILKYEPEQKYVKAPAFVSEKERIPSRQLFAMYAINRIIS